MKKSILAGLLLCHLNALGQVDQAALQHYLGPNSNAETLRAFMEGRGYTILFTHRSLSCRMHGAGNAVSFYHGADELYVPASIPGVWHE